MRITTAALLVAAWWTLSPQAKPRIELAVTGSPHMEVTRGIELGVAETSQTLELLGGSVRLVPDSQAASPPLAGIIVTGASSPKRPGVPRIQLGGEPAAGDPCSFSVAPPPTSTGAVLWHPRLNRYGASELNERYVKRYRTGMSGRAYAGWVAVKALVESALRTRGGGDRCAALGRLRFDGHKGRPLTFDPVTRILQQPFYTADGDPLPGDKR